MAKIDKSLSEVENLVKLLKEANPRFTYAASTLDFAAAQGSEEEGFNTSVLAQAVGGAPFTGENTYHYNRLDLANGGLDPLLGTEYTVVEGDTPENLPGKLLAYFRLPQDSVEFGEIGMPNDEGPGSVVISAYGASYLYLPESSVEITLVKQAEEPDTLADLADVTHLNGFDPESSVPAPEYVHDPIVEPAPVSSAETKPNGTLLNGTGNPATDLTVAQNGELSLATSARAWKSQTTVAPVDGVYSVSFDPETGDWNFPISVALLNTEAGSVVTDLYDVQFTLGSLDRNTELTFDLIREEGVYKWRNEEHDLTIDDNSVSEDGTVIQNIQRARFYAQELQLIDFTVGGAPYGTFELRLTATRKDTLLDPMVLSVMVEANLPEA